MSRPGSHSRAARIFCAGLLALALAAPLLLAGIRGPGRYHGVVVYDRWGNCYLFSGVYLMYISDSVKELLRPYAGKSMEIDAKAVHQPRNPGDGLITSLNVIGESRPDPRHPNETPAIAGIELRADVSRVSAARFRAILKLSNSGSSTISVESDAVGYAVFAHDKPLFLRCPSDGTSCAPITRLAATSPDGENRANTQTWGWEFNARDRLPERFTLSPGETRATSVTFILQPGEYQFIAGYGGGVHAGPCVASNAVPFDAKGR